MWIFMHHFYGKTSDMSPRVLFCCDTLSISVVVVLTVLMFRARALLWFQVSNPESPRAHPKTNSGSAPGWDHHTQGLHLRHPGWQRHRCPELLPGSHAATWCHHENITGYQRRHECAGDRYFFCHNGWVAGMEATHTLSHSNTHTSA